MIYLSLDFLRTKWRKKLDGETGSWPRPPPFYCRLDRPSASDRSRPNSRTRRNPPASSSRCWGKEGDEERQQQILSLLRHVRIVLNVPWTGPRARSICARLPGRQNASSHTHIPTSGTRSQSQSTCVRDFQRTRNCLIMSRANEKDNHAIISWQ